MLKMRRFGSVAAILVGVAAFGAGAGVSQASGAGDGGARDCVESHDSIRCEKTGEYHYTTSDGGSVTITNKETQSCRVEEKERPEQRPVVMGDGEASSVGSTCVQNGHHYTLP
jgi:hypothetical protein